MDVFIEEYSCNDETYRKQVAIDGKICMLELLELTGESFWDSWVDAMDGIVLAYSTDSRSSFMNVRAFFHKIIKSIIKNGGDVDDYALFLVGNKNENMSKREVSRAEGIALAQEFCCEFIETSAKNALHVEEPFYGIVRALRNRRVPQRVENGNATNKATDQGFFQFIRQIFRRRSFHRQRLLKKKLDSRLSPDEQSAFYTAAATGNFKVVEMLLTMGADVGAKGVGYMRPLQVAAMEGHANIVRLLLENGASVDEKTRMHGTALICASSKGNIDVVRVLLDHGADVNEKGGLYGNALQAAAALGNLDLARVLLDSGANFDATGDGGFTALQIAAFASRFDMIELLLSQGAPSDLQLATSSPITSPFSGHVASHLDYGASEDVRVSAQVIVDLVHHQMLEASEI